jgi:hypothetical protein
MEEHRKCFVCRAPTGRTWEVERDGKHFCNGLCEQIYLMDRDGVTPRVPERQCESAHS